MCHERRTRGVVQVSWPGVGRAVGVREMVEVWLDVDDSVVDVRVLVV